MEIGDIVAWGGEDPDVSYYGIVRDLDSEGSHLFPDAAFVMELGAWHRLWGHSTGGRGERHSLLIADLKPASANERGIARNFDKLCQKTRDEIESTYQGEVVS